MPFFGLLSFLHLSTKVPNVEVTDRVNALLRASLISTLTMSLPICRPIVSMPFFGLLSFLRLQRCGVGLSLEQVSMPFFGLLSFLPKYQFFMEYLKNCVNALLRASLISTLRKEIWIWQKEGVNALLRASLISTLTSYVVIAYSKNVSMPFFGLLSFLHNNELSSTATKEVCQCPSSGFSHFYGVEEDKYPPYLKVSMPFFGLLSFLRNR